MNPAPPVTRHFISNLLRKWEDFFAFPKNPHHTFWRMHPLYHSRSLLLDLHNQCFDYASEGVEHLVSEGLEGVPLLYKQQDTPHHRRFHPSHQTHQLIPMWKLELSVLRVL